MANNIETYSGKSIAQQLLAILNSVNDCEEIIHIQMVMTLKEKMLHSRNLQMDNLLKELKKPLKILEI